MPELLLASASPRRKELLELIGVSFTSQAMDIDESVMEHEPPDAYVERLAREKALAGLRAHPGKLILAADTTVVLQGQILGKPEDAVQARDMLQQLSSSRHQVLTGMAVACQKDGQTKIQSQVVCTEVVFAEINEQQIDAYIHTGEPMDKAGAYGIQGKAALFVERIEGSYSNVVGLPLAETGKLLECFGFPLWS